MKKPDIAKPVDTFITIVEFMNSKEFTHNAAGTVLLKEVCEKAAKYEALYRTQNWKTHRYPQNGET